jgi:L-alanine-DL-glutamate epimerase-like enolase superfamily enzyme
MALKRIELYELTLPLVEPFIISGGTMTHRRSLVLLLRDEAGNLGFGESRRRRWPEPDTCWSRS